MSATDIETAINPQVNQAYLELDDHYLRVHLGRPGGNCLQCFRLEDDIQQAIENAQKSNQTPPRTRP